MRRSLLPAVFLPIILACRSGAPPSDGRISIAWTGSRSGTFTAPATGRWCAADTLLEVIAVRNDTAVGFTLIAEDSARAARYPVTAIRMWTPGRPQATVGLRWLGTLELHGYQGFGGTVLVSAGGTGAVTGTIDVQMRPLMGNDTLHLTGRFTRIAIGLGSPPCGRADRPGPG